jgi:hypothetical protein
MAKTDDTPIELNDELTDDKHKVSYYEAIG